jgi:hypothetical protein
MRREGRQRGRERERKERERERQRDRERRGSERKREREREHLHDSIVAASDTKPHGHTRTSLQPIGVTLPPLPIQRIIE